MPLGGSCKCHCFALAVRQVVRPATATCRLLGAPFEFHYLFIFSMCGFRRVFCKFWILLGFPYVLVEQKKYFLFLSKDVPLEEAHICCASRKGKKYSMRFYKKHNLASARSTACASRKMGKAQYVLLLEGTTVLPREAEPVPSQKKGKAQRVLPEEKEKHNVCFPKK